jgi:hypothetical protein
MRGRGGQAVLTVKGKNLPRTLIRHGFAVPPSPWKGEGFWRVPLRCMLFDTLKIGYADSIVLFFPEFMLS